MEQVLLSDLKIRPKDKKAGLITLAPNAVQAAYLDTLHAEHAEFDWRSGCYTLRGIREDILKARQQGFSTLWLALYFLDTINNPLTQTMIIAHDTATTEKLFKIVHRFYENLPAHKKRPKKYSSRGEIAFSDIDSIISVGTAGGRSVGRGGTVNNVHMSERAFWKDGNDVETGLLESMPEDGNVTRETTANGMNDYFEERQEMLRGESVYTPRFFAWFQDPSYRREVPPGFEIEPGRWVQKDGGRLYVPSTEERLRSAYGLDDEQLVWRRYKVKQQKKKFAQEYPANQDEAFLTSGNPYFDIERLKALGDILQGAAHDPLRGVELPAAYPRLRAAYASGHLLLWKLPQSGANYVIGADTAEGLTESGDTDYDAADVLDRATWEQCAHLSGRWDTQEYGLLLAELGRWYGTALLGIERNNHGHAVINAVMHTAAYAQARGNSAGGLYFHEDFDQSKNAATLRPGWPTTSKTKYFALDELATGLGENGLVLHCRETVAQLMRFVHRPGGKAGGDGNSHDDCVMALSIAVVMAKMRPKKWYQSESVLDGLKSELRE